MTSVRSTSTSSTKSKRKATSGAGSTVSKRLMKELQVICKEKPEGVSAFPANGILAWNATIEGGGGTVYEGLSFKLTVEFGAEYPYKPPTVKFVTPCFHPNVSTNGEICLDILQDKWSPVYNAKSVLLSIQSLLADPNPDSPLNAQAARMWESGLEEYRAYLVEFHKNAASAPQLVSK